MATIKIEFDGNSVEAATAIAAVKRVVKGGLVSKNKHGPHYCALTTFTNGGIEVYASRSVTQQTFRVYKREDK